MIHAGFESVIFQILFIWVIANKIFGKKKIAAIVANAKTIKDPRRTSFPVGQVTLKASCFTP